MANIFENPRAPFIGRSPVPGPQTPPGQSFGNFYFGGTPRMNTMQRPRANSGGQAPMPTGYEYGAGISGGAGYETWGTPNNVQNNQGQANTGYTPDNIFNTGYESNNIFNAGGSVTPRPGGNGLSAAQNQEIMNNLPTPMPVGPELGQGIPEDIQTGPAPGGGPQDTAWRGPPRPGLVGGTIASWDGYSQDPTFKGYWDSEFYTPNRNNSWQGNETPWSGYYDNMEVSGGSPTERGFFHQYLDSIGRSDLYSKPDSVTPNPGQTWKEGDNLGHFSADVSMPGGGDLIQPMIPGNEYQGTINPKTGRMFPPGVPTLNTPADFGPPKIGAVNPVTGETTPIQPWQQGGGVTPLPFGGGSSNPEALGGLPRPATSSPSLKRNIFGT